MPRIPQIYGTIAGTTGSYPPGLDPGSISGDRGLGLGPAPFASCFFLKVIFLCVFVFLVGLLSLYSEVPYVRL